MNGHLRLPAAQPRQRLLRHRPNRFSRHITEDEEARGKRPAGEAGLGEALAQQHDGGVLEGVILAHGSAKGQLLHDLFDQIHVLVLISTHPGARGPLTSAMGMNGLLPLGNHCAIRDTFARAMTPRAVAFGQVDRHTLSTVRGVPLGKPPAGKTVAVILVASKYLGPSVPSSSRGHRACSSLAGWPEARSPLAFAMGSVTAYLRDRLFSAGTTLGRSTGLSAAAVSITGERRPACMTTCILQSDNQNHRRANGRRQTPSTYAKLIAVAVRESSGSGTVASR